MSDKEPDSPDFLTYAAGTGGIASVIYLISSSFSRPHGPSPIIDALVYIAAMAFGLTVLFIAIGRLFPDGDKSLNKLTMTKARLKLGAALLLSMFASGSLSLVYFFIF